MFSFRSSFKNGITTIHILSVSKSISGTRSSCSDWENHFPAFKVYLHRSSNRTKWSPNLSTSRKWPSFLAKFFEGLCDFLGVWQRSINQCIPPTKYLTWWALQWNPNLQLALIWDHPPAWQGNLLSAVHVCIRLNSQSNRFTRMQGL